MSDKQTVAPARRDPEGEQVLYRNSRMTELQGRDPDYHYESFSTDPTHPSFIGERLRTHERGSAAGGFVMIKPWETVNDMTDPAVKHADPRTDQGGKTDSLLKFGTQIVCRIKKSEHAKYKLAEDATNKVRERELFSPDRQIDRQASLTTVLSPDENANQMQMLQQAGHPMPGAQAGR